MLGLRLFPRGKRPAIPHPAPASPRSSGSASRAPDRRRPEAAPAAPPRSSLPPRCCTLDSASPRALIFFSMVFMVCVSVSALQLQRFAGLHGQPVVGRVDRVRFQMPLKLSLTIARKSPALVAGTPLISIWNRVGGLDGRRIVAGHVRVGDAALRRADPSGAGSPCRLPP